MPSTTVLHITRNNRQVLSDLTKQHVNNSTKIQATQNKPRITRLATKRFQEGQEEHVKKEKEVVKVENVVERLTLPVGVTDIDDDARNPQLCSDYAFDIFLYLRKLEEKGAVKPNHLLECPTNDKMRAVLVDWLVEVQIQFKLLQETLFATINILDRYIAVEGSSVDRNSLQLVGITSMFLAAKIEEVYAPAISDFVYISDNAYNEDQIKKTELKILRALNFQMFQPISLNFLRRFSKAGDVDVLQHNLAKYALEVGLLDYSLVSIPNSLLAASALYLSLLLLEPSDFTNTVWNSSLAFYSQYTREDLVSISAMLAGGIVSISRKSSKLQAVKTKYQSAKFLKVADLEVLKSDILAKLALLKI